MPETIEHFGQLDCGSGWLAAVTGRERIAACSLGVLPCKGSSLRRIAALIGLVQLANIALEHLPCKG
eukprot:363584-Alexandrium_andersonii.AAC.1